jgi:hypothetical protein
MPGALWLVDYSKATLGSMTLIARPKATPAAPLCEAAARESEELLIQPMRAKSALTKTESLWSSG